MSHPPRDQSKAGCDPAALLRPELQAAAIADRLQADQTLIAILCAPWCQICEGWTEDLQNWLRQPRQASALETQCWVWVDIEAHPDLVAGFDLDDLPLLLVHGSHGIHVLESVRALVQAGTTPDYAQLLALTNLELDTSHTDPGLRDYLMHP